MVSHADLDSNLPTVDVEEEQPLVEDNASSASRGRIGRLAVVGLLGLVGVVMLASSRSLGIVKGDVDALQQKLSVNCNSLSAPDCPAGTTIDSLANCACCNQGGSLLIGNCISGGGGDGVTNIFGPVPSPSPAPAASCFPGDATVLVENRGFVPIANTEIGARVLVRQPKGELAYQPVMSFLHATAPGKRSNLLNVSHQRGELHISDNHVVFVAGGITKRAAELQEEDELVVIADGVTTMKSQVKSVSHLSTDLSLYAPLTEAGTVVVDNVLASNYATVGSTSLPHGAMHAVFFPARVFYKLGLAALFSGSNAGTPMQEEGERIHPLASLYLSYGLPLIEKP